MKKKLAALIGCLMVFTMSSQMVLAADSNWSGTATDSHYTISNGVITSDEATIFQGVDNVGESENNFFVTDEYSIEGDYTLTVDTKGTMSLPNNKEVRIGAVPYYLDENNFIYTYIHWSHTDRPTDIRCVQFSGLINGKPLMMYDAANDDWISSRWNDNWCDGIAIGADEDIKIEVTKKNDGDNVVFGYVVSNADGEIKSLEGLTLKAADLSKDGKIGVMSYGDTVTFTNFASTGAVAGATTETVAPEATEAANSVPKTGVVGLELVYGLAAVATGVVAFKKRSK